MKKKKKALFSHYASALPRNSKINFLRNERQRIQVFNTDDIAETRPRLLHTNGYPENVILKTKRPRRRRHQPQQQHSSKDWLYFEILFISDRLDRKITKIFRKENIDARITHRVYTLRNALSTRRNEPQCKRTNCPVAHRQFAFVETPSTRSHATDASNSMSAAPTDTHTTG